MCESEAAGSDEAFKVLLMINDYINHGGRTDIIRRLKWWISDT